MGQNLEPKSIDMYYLTLGYAREMATMCSV